MTRSQTSTRSLLCLWAGVVICLVLVLWVDLKTTTRAAVVSGKAPPELEFVDLVSNTPESELDLCDTRGPLNETTDMTALAVKTNRTLSFTARVIDPDGDSVRVYVDALSEPLSDFTTVTYNDSQTSATFEITPTEGINTEALCEQIGDISIRARDFSAERLEVTRDIPVFIKCDCPDLEVELFDPPLEGNLYESIRVSARVTCHGYNSGPFTVSMWLEDPDGHWVASRYASFDNLAVGDIASVPQISYIPEEVGQYCVKVNVISANEIVTANSRIQYYLLVGSGPFTVRPNVATPNGDGINDNVHFLFANQSLNQPRVRIFTLGGELIHETDELDSEQRLVWDGRDRDYEPVPTGSYLYVVYDGAVKYRTGMCGVIR